MVIIFLPVVNGKFYFLLIFFSSCSISLQNKDYKPVHGEVVKMGIASFFSCKLHSTGLESSKHEEISYESYTFCNDIPDFTVSLTEKNEKLYLLVSGLSGLSGSDKCICLFYFILFSH